MRQEKQLLLDEIKQKIDASEAFIITSYHQLRAPAMSKFRRLIAATGGEFEVVRKRVFLKASDAFGVQFNKKDFEGHVGVLFASKNAIEMTKAVYAFTKENNDAIRVLAGHFDGKVYTAANVETLSKLPSMQEMRAQFLGLLEAPMSQTLGVMDALLTSILHCLENKSKKEEQA